ncbi:hypothetical protein THAOC_11700, partial [Thalassiosira oceanica]
MLGVLEGEPVPHQLVKTERLPQLLERSIQAYVGFVVVFRQAAPFLFGRTLPKALPGRLVRKGSLLAGSRDPEPCARPPELRQSIRVEVRSASNKQVAAQDVKQQGDDWEKSASRHGRSEEDDTSCAGQSMSDASEASRAGSVGSAGHPAAQNLERALMASGHERPEGDV